MQITLSFATTADGYLDDNSPRRLMISTPEDWEAVLRLRASHDAILALSLIHISEPTRPY